MQACCQEHGLTQCAVDGVLGRGGLAAVTNAFCCTVLAMTCHLYTLEAWPACAWPVSFQIAAPIISMVICMLGHPGSQQQIWQHTMMILVPWLHALTAAVPAN